MAVDERLERNEFDGETFDALDHSEKELRGRQFHGCRFRNSRFVATRFPECVFIDCDFTGCELDRMDCAGAVFRDATFRNCRMMAVDWRRVSQLLVRLRFEGCTISYSVFDGLQLGRIVMVRCKAEEVSFADTDLSGSRFHGTDFTGSRFQNTNLERADLSQASGYVIDPGDNRLSDTRFSLEAATQLLKLQGVLVASLTE